MPTQGEIPVACLLLAAGSSRRMGAADKLTLPLADGVTVLERTARELGRAAFAQRFLVLRSKEGRLLFDAEALGFELLEIGAEAEAGLHRSLRRGLERVAPGAEAAMICLGDQPFLRAEDYSLLLAAYAESLAQGYDLLRPIAAGLRGNPALIHRSYFPEILAEPDLDRGCRYLFDRHPGRVREWEAPSDAFFRDLDTPEDYRSCLN